MAVNLCELLRYFAKRQTQPTYPISPEKLSSKWTKPAQKVRENMNE